MKKKVQPASELHNSSNSGFAAVQFIAAFSLSELISCPYNYLMVLVPLLICEGALIVFYLHKINIKNQPIQPVPIQKLPEARLQAMLQPQPKPVPKARAVVIEKAEVVGDTVKFSVKKGLFSKRWFVTKQLPIYEIQSMELSGNEISITWREFTDSFVFKKRGESFGKLRDQIVFLLEERKKELEKEQKIMLRKSDLTGAITASMNAVDLSFDILMALQVKRVNWSRLEGYAKGLGEGLNFAGPTIAPLSVDVSKVSSAIKMGIPKEATKETLSVLDSIYGYFNGLNPEDDITEAHPNFKDAKAVITVYYMLNDLLLGRIVGERDSMKENSALETALVSLASETNAKINVDELKGYVDKISADNDIEGVVEDTREFFKEKLKPL